MTARSKAPRRRTVTRKPAKVLSPKSQSPKPKLPHEAAGLSLNHHQFALGYLSNGYNATAAYKAAYPEAKDNTARTGGYDLLAKPDIKAFLATQLENRWKPLQMDAEEATALVGLDARVDIRQFFDEKGVLLLPAQWPDDVARCVKSYKLGANGPEIRLNDSLAARRLVLELTGKLKGGDGALRDLAEILAEKWKDGPA